MEVLSVQPPKLLRLPVGFQPKKNPITSHQMHYLLHGRTIVEELMDGKPLKLISSDGRFMVFAGDILRSRSTCYRLPGRFAIFDILDTGRRLFINAEDKLELSMDIRKGRLRLGEASSPLAPDSFFLVPRIACGRFVLADLLQFLDAVSPYARSEDCSTCISGKGIVVKPVASSFPETFYPGKIVRAELENHPMLGEDSSWTHRENSSSSAARTRLPML